jgi:putative FmdB family regulatory protein
MPIFEFMCERCGTHFEELVRSSSSIEGVICPACDSAEVSKQISTFASKISGSSSSSRWSAPVSNCSTGSL